MAPDLWELAHGGGDMTWQRARVLRQLLPAGGNLAGVQWSASPLNDSGLDGIHEGCVLMSATEITELPDVLIQLAHVPFCIVRHAAIVAAHPSQHDKSITGRCPQQIATFQCRHINYVAILRQCGCRWQRCKQKERRSEGSAGLLMLFSIHHLNLYGWLQLDGDTWGLMIACLPTC